MNNQEQLIKAITEKPSKYEIEVLENEMLPKNLKQRKTLLFVIKPPTLEVLALCAEPMLKIPNEIREKENVDLKDALKYRKEIAEVLAILSHGKSTEYPKWYVNFFLKNLTGKDLYQLFYETSLKINTGFFLNSFQIASQTNPMMM
ncbi:MAG: hypothetical protein KGV59_05420 [Tenacibaculum sp.]|nr:hypothetical protein [Tenacibaculum sp.]